DALAHAFRQALPQPEQEEPGGFAVLRQGFADGGEGKLLDEAELDGAALLVGQALDALAESEEALLLRLPGLVQPALLQFHAPGVQEPVLQLGLTDGDAEIVAAVVEGDA